MNTLRPRCEHQCPDTFPGRGIYSWPSCVRENTGMIKAFSHLSSTRFSLAFSLLWFTPSLLLTKVSLLWSSSGGWWVLTIPAPGLLLCRSEVSHHTLKPLLLPFGPGVQTWPRQRPCSFSKWVIA